MASEVERQAASIVVAPFDFALEHTMKFLTVIMTFDIIALAIAYVFLISLKSYNWLYRKFYVKNYRPEYFPKIAIFIPCKGADRHFESNIDTFLEHPYQNAKMFFIVESRNDPAYPIISHRIRQTKHTAQLVVAGLSVGCGQKNHNLLKGIKVCEEHVEAYVFLDAYTTITPQQLGELVLPLSDPNITVANGFRWHRLNKHTLGERLHAFMIAIQWSLMNCIFVQTVWGGATAIRREDFEKLGVREYWAKTVVDDMTLQKILIKHRKTAVFVPTCIKETDNTVANIPDAIAWFTRQSLYVKFYLRPYWIGSLAMLSYPSVNILAFPFLLGYAALHPDGQFPLLTITTGLFILSIMCYCLGLKRSTNDHHSRISWWLLSPLYLLLTCYACLVGMFTNNIQWRGVSYQLDYDGTVKKIFRHR